jgi:hypothetical protein
VSSFAKGGLAIVASMVMSPRARLEACGRLEVARDLLERVRASADGERDDHLAQRLSDAERALRLLLDALEARTMPAGAA